MRVAAIGLVLALSACVDNGVDGRQAFVEDCSSCHGRDAMGNGPAAVAMGVEAPGLTGLAAANGGVFPRNQVMAIIDGLNRDPHFSAAMPEFGAGDMGDPIMVEEDGLAMPVPARLLALADYLEAIQDLPG